MNFLLEILGNKTARTIAGLILLLAVVFGYIEYLRYEVEVKTRQAEAATAEVNRKTRESEGLKILINANNQVAKEVEDAKKLSNRQQENINSAVNNFNTSVKRDSNSFNGSVSDSQFCLRFPTDSTCIEFCRHYPCPAPR